jgi:hypothetical protein
MRKIISIIIIKSFIVSSLLCQSNNLEHELLSLELKQFESNDIKEKLATLVEKVNLEMVNPSYYALLQEDLIRIRSIATDANTSETILYNQCLIALSLKNYDQMNLLLEELKAKKDTLDLSERILSACLSIIKYDTTQFKADIQHLQSDTSTILCSLNLNKKKYTTMSIVLPGLGMMALGKPTKGILALGLNTAAIAGTIYLISKGFYFAGFNTGLTIIPKFYAGNIRLTESVFNRKNNQLILNNQKEMLKKMDEVLALHPLNFKKLVN